MSKPKNNVVECKSYKSNKCKFKQTDLIHIEALTDSQQEFLDTYYDGKQLILQRGAAGTGKSMLALHSALKQLFDGSLEFHKIIIIRSAVEARTQGHLPGEKEDKDAPFELPYRKICQDIIKVEDSYDKLKSDGYLEFMTTSHLRGLTFDNCILIVEEAQNMNESEIRTIISRIGEHSRIVITGDSKQNDLIYKKNDTSGFAYLEKVMSYMPDMYVHTIEYTVQDVVRSGLAREFLIADYKVG